MEINEEELKKDLEEQYATLEAEVQEDKNKKRYLIVFIFFLILFLVIFGTTFGYYKIYNQTEVINSDTCLINELYIENYEDEFEFDCSIKSYALSIKSVDEILNIQYNLINPKMNIDIIGNENFKPGINEIKIIITDENSNKQEYIIYVIVEEDSEDETNELFLKNLFITNHSMNRLFLKNRYNYISDTIKYDEDKIVVNFELMDNSNIVELKLNDSKVTRIPTINNNIYYIYFNVQSELNMGANKLEIILKDNQGNEKTYTVFLIVSNQNSEQRVIKISVDYGNDNGKYIVANVVPGWESSERQHIIVSNTSNYDTNIDLLWTNVTNSFTNINDLEYTLYKENKIIKEGKLPIKDEYIIKNLELVANSTTNYYISYRYLYQETSQNEDQGKEFNSQVKVELSK